jgi:hypothetical protein
MQEAAAASRRRRPVEGSPWQGLLGTEQLSAALDESICYAIRRCGLLDGSEKSVPGLGRVSPDDNLNRPFTADPTTAHSRQSLDRRFFTPGYSIDVHGP